MAFVDDLALIEVLLLLAAAVLAYSGILVWWAVRSNQPAQLKKILRGAAIPVGFVGAATLVIAIWGEMTWPFPAADGMAGYNIFFFDPLLLFALVMISYAATTFLSLRLQYVGLFSLVAGGVTAFYGWTGYTASPAFTKDPFDTLLLYSAFAMAGILTFPATVILDYYQSTVEGVRAQWQTSKHVFSYAGFRSLGTRGAQPVVGSPKAEPTESSGLHYGMPLVLQGIFLLFPIFMALAAVAALWYFGITLPGHLGTGPGGAP
jgi:uncharacterized membrane protein